MAASCVSRSRHHDRRRGTSAKNQITLPVAVLDETGLQRRRGRRRGIRRRRAACPSRAPLASRARSGLSPASIPPTTSPARRRRRRAVTVVLDADVLIGALDGATAHHATARTLFGDWRERGELVVVSLVNPSEVLVASAGDRQTLRRARTAIAALGVEVHQLNGAVGVDAGGRDGVVAADRLVSPARFVVASQSRRNTSSRRGGPVSGTRSSSSSAIESCHRAFTSCAAMNRPAAATSSDSK